MQSLWGWAYDGVTCFSPEMMPIFIPIWEPFTSPPGSSCYRVLPILQERCCSQWDEAAPAVCCPSQLDCPLLSDAGLAYNSPDHTKAATAPSNGVACFLFPAGHKSWPVMTPSLFSTFAGGRSLAGRRDFFPESHLILWNLKLMEVRQRQAPLGRAGQGL